MPQRIINLEYFGAVDECRIRVGLVRAVGDITGREITANVSNVEFVLEGHLHFEARESDGTSSATSWIDTGDTSDKEICVG